MDMDEFKDLFISETKEELDKISIILDDLNKMFGESVEIEVTKENKEMLVKLKRSFHTIKGNAAAMDYTKIFALSKVYNDLCTEVMDQQVDLSKDILDLYKSGLELLKKSIEYVQNNKLDELNVKDLSKKVKFLIDY